jgi:hypothetical protein
MTASAKASSRVEVCGGIADRSNGVCGGACETFIEVEFNFPTTGGGKQGVDETILRVVFEE